LASLSTLRFAPLLAKCLVADRGYVDGEEMKTIVHHDDSRSQRIFWLSREFGVAGKKAI